MKEYNIKHCFQRLYASLTGKALVVVIAMAMQTEVCADDKPVFPKGVPEDAVWLKASDSGSYNSLTTGSVNNWSDNKAIQSTDTNKNYYVPSGLTARTLNEGDDRTVVPVIYGSGRIYPRFTGSIEVFFNDLRLLDGGYVDHAQTCIKKGKITILATDPDNPASFLYNRVETYASNNRLFRLKATLEGAENSQLRYYGAAGKGKDFLSLLEGSDWSGFKGTLSVADGFGICSNEKVPIASPCKVVFQKGGILQLTADDAPCSFGNLSFVDGGAITNTGSGATLTVSGTFDTGTNCRWASNNEGTFGTLILGDGLTLIDDQETPATVLTVNDQLLVGKDVTIKYPKSSFFEKMPLMKLAPKAVEAGIPDFSDVKVRLGDSSTVSMLRLTAEPDAENEGWYVVYVTWKDPFVYYNGPDEWGQKDLQGSWLDKTIAPEYWGDGLYPDGEKVYCATQRVYFAPNKVTTFPGKALLCMEDLCLEVSGIVTNLFLGGAGTIYARSDNVRIGGRDITLLDETEFLNLAHRTLYVDSALHGTGDLTFNSVNPVVAGGATFYLSADNSDWTGAMKFDWSKDKDSPVDYGVTNHVRIVVGDAKSLGGNTAEFSCTKIVLNRYSEIRFTNTTVQAASNRGLYVSMGMINVDSGKTADLSAPMTLYGTFYKIGGGTLGLGGGVRWAVNDDLTDLSEPKSGKNKMLIKEGGIKCSSLKYAAVTFSDGTAIVADDKSGAMDLTGATVTAEGTIYLTADGNTLEEPAQAVTYPVVKVSATQAATLGARFKAKKSPWSGWPVTVVSNTDKDGNVIYSVKYEKKGFVMSIR